jgi:hypothetical protein
MAPRRRWRRLRAGLTTPRPARRVPDAELFEVARLRLGSGPKRGMPPALARRRPA